MRWLHPRRATLSSYVRGEAPDRVARHIAGCDRCTRMLETMTRPSEEVTTELAAIVEPRPEFISEVGPRVVSELRERHSLGVVADLFGAGWDTVWLLTHMEDGRGDE